MTQELLTATALSILFGLLVGIQRERNEADRMGARTFTMLTLFGTVCGFLGKPMGYWIVGSGFFVTLGLVVLGYLSRGLPHQTESDGEKIQTDRSPRSIDSSQEPSEKKNATSNPIRRRGMTTEVAAVLMFSVGVLLALGYREFAIVVGGLVAVLLQAKPQLHMIARRLGEEDVRAMMTFILVACIVLPILPNQNFGPYNVLNPQEIWLFVVLIVGLNLSGYLAYRFFGERAGIWLGGIMGGIVSSTATAVSWSRCAKDDAKLIPASEVVILVATAISFFRVLVLIGAVSIKLAWEVATPLGLLGSICLVESLWLAWSLKRSKEKLQLQMGNRTTMVTSTASQMPDSMVKNPTQLKAALWFAALYGVIVLGIAAVKAHLSFSGPIMMVVAAISGLTDMDAIVLSTARLVGATDPTAALSLTDGRMMIVSAAIGAILFKIGIVTSIGGLRQGWRMVKYYAIPIIAACIAAL